MKVLGILGTHNPAGVTGQMLQAVLKGAAISADTEWVDLNDYALTPDHDGLTDPDLDALETKMLAADVWVLAAPTYLGGLAGVMKNFLDCFRNRIARYNAVGEAVPDRFKNKHYVTITDCYAGGLENYVTGVTDAAFKTMDKFLTMGGLIKSREIVVTGTWGMQTLSAKKQAEGERVGAAAAHKVERDDNTVKRYIQLFFMIAVMALITMGIEAGVGRLFPLTNFWAYYGVFVVIFYVLLASILHFFTVVKHRRR
ncbi:NADPH-dependent oxidoreductase [Lactiplantibacillus garii]|uniref:NADPH-dependent oxidoreductase n=1 Tax=Lactiplantibacillus garii TaxID=2306423 RepID=A0A3R8KNH6_9LACO|nr:NAD(P)H-dependent oxidoreductase [Lactiplantibacillus garii]RRK11653.1 NADPH-dependent oxidoreductase [Lactiplantibacillus garii]